MKQTVAAKGGGQPCSFGKAFGGFGKAASFLEALTADGQEQCEFFVRRQGFQITIRTNFLFGDGKGPLFVIVVVVAIHPFARGFDVEAFACSLPADEEMRFRCDQLERIPKTASYGDVKHWHGTAR